MTVIVAMKANNKIYMGCDSSFVSSGQITRRTQSKLVIKDELIIGLTSNGCKIIQILKHKLKLASTKKLKSEELECYLSTIFCNKLFKALSAENILEDDNDRKTSEPSMSPARLLIGIRDRLFEIGEDFDVSEVDTDYHAIGGGDKYALGSLEATINLLPQLGPEDHLIFALKTTTKHMPIIGSPYHLINTGDLCLSRHL